MIEKKWLNDYPGNEQFQGRRQQIDLTEQKFMYNSFFLTYHFVHVLQ